MRCDATSHVGLAMIHERWPPQIMPRKLLNAKPTHMPTSQCHHHSLTHSQIFLLSNPHHHHHHLFFIICIFSLQPLSFLDFFSIIISESLDLNSRLLFTCFLSLLVGYTLIRSFLYTLLRLN